MIKSQIRRRMVNTVDFVS